MEETDYGITFADFEECMDEILTKAHRAQEELDELHSAVKGLERMAVHFEREFSQKDIYKLKNIPLEDWVRKLKYWAYHIADTAHGPYIYNLRVELPEGVNYVRFTYTQARKDDVLYREFDCTMRVPLTYLKSDDYKNFPRPEYYRWRMLRPRNK